MNDFPPIESRAKKEMEKILLNQCSFTGSFFFHCSSGNGGKIETGN